MRFALLLLLTAVAAFAQTVPNIKNVQFCPNTPNGGPGLQPTINTDGSMRRVTITAPNALCNDGSPAIMYVRSARAGTTEPDGVSTANRWVIHIEGGGGCSTYEDCLVRWCGLGFYTARQMSTTYEAETISRFGLLDRNSINRLGDRNEVMLNYCSSDSWSGQKSDVVLRSTEDTTKAYTMNYRGADIVRGAIAQLKQGVTGLPKLTDANDVLLSGDSAGAAAVRTHLDSIAADLKAANPNVRVRGQMEATFYPDTNGKQGFPAGDPRDPVFARKLDTYKNVDVALLNGYADESCKAAHPGDAAYLCTDGGYVELNHLTTPFFQIQDYADPGMLESLVEGGASVTAVQVSQRVADQMVELGNIRNTAVEKAAITAAPATVGRMCGVHVMWGENDGFLGRKIRSGPGQTAYSYYELLWNWMNGVSPSSVLAPRPPATPDPPENDSICNATAQGVATPTIATASSASYNFAGAVAPDSIVVTFGAGLTTSTVTATTNPWPTTLSGLQINVTDSLNVTRPARIYYVSPTQVMYLIPTGTAPGTAQITIGAQRTTVTVANTAPSLYSANQRGTGVAAASFIRITPNGTRTEDLLFNTGTNSTKPIPVGAGDQVYLILYGTGMRGGTATATVGGVSVPILGGRPVAQPQYPGLDQVNLGPLPLRIGYGTKDIVIRQGDRIANVVTVTFWAP